MADLEQQLKQWREDTEDLTVPSGMVDRISQRLVARASEPVSSGATPLADLEDTEIGALLDQTLMTDPKLRALPAPESEALPVAVEMPLPPSPPADPGAAVWYLGIDGRELGPLAPARIAELWSVGEIGPDTLSWRPGFSDWSPLAQVDELLRQIAPRPTTARVSSLLPEPQNAEPEPNRPVPLLSSLAKDEIEGLSEAIASAPAPRRSGSDSHLGTSRASWPTLPAKPERMSWSDLPRGLVAGLAVASVSLLAMMSLLILLWMKAIQPLPERAPVVAPAAVIADGAPAAVSTAPAVSASNKPSEGPPAERSAIKAAAPEPSTLPVRKRRAGGRPAAASNAGGEQIVASSGRHSAPAAASDEFATVFAADSDGKPEGKAPKKPTERGVAALPEQVSQSEVMGVVFSHKPEVVRCIDEQRRRAPGVSGRLVMRWRIRPNGSPHQISVQSEDLKGSPLGKCLADLIQGWSFPRHQVDGAPIDFPFAF